MICDTCRKKKYCKKKCGAYNKELKIRTQQAFVNCFFKSLEKVKHNASSTN